MQQGSTKASCKPQQSEQIKSDGQHQCQSLDTQEDFNTSSEHLIRKSLKSQETEALDSHQEEQCPQDEQHSTRTLQQVQNKHPSCVRPNSETESNNEASPFEPQEVSTEPLNDDTESLQDQEKDLDSQVYVSLKQEEEVEEHISNDEQLQITLSGKKSDLEQQEIVEDNIPQKNVGASQACQEFEKRSPTPKPQEIMSPVESNAFTIVF